MGKKMNDRLKCMIILGYFLVIYSGIIMVYLGYSYKISLLLFCLFNLIVFLKIFYIINFRDEPLKIATVFLSILLFAIFMVIFVFAERLIMNAILCGMDGYGYLRRHGYIDCSCADLSPGDHLFWDILSTLYYPIYIFIFIKPFVGYLKKSIQVSKKIL